MDGASGVEMVAVLELDDALELANLACARMDYLRAKLDKAESAAQQRDALVQALQSWRRDPTIGAYRVLMATLESAEGAA